MRLLGVNAAGWICSVCAGLPQATDAAEWQVKGNYQQELQFDDNIGLRTEASAVFGTIMRPSFEAGWKSKSMQLGIQGQGEVRRYDDSLWDCETYSLGSGNAIQHKNHAFSLQGGYSLSCTYTQQAADTGLLIPNNQYENYHLTPSWTWQWSPLDELRFSPAYNQSDFVSGSALNASQNGRSLQGNKTFSLNLSENHRISRRLAVNGGGFYSHTEYTRPEARPQSVYGLQIGAQYALSRAWSVNLGGGGRWVDSDRVSRPALGNGGNPQFGELANLGIHYKGKHDNASLTFSRTVNPSAIGQLSQYTSLGLRYGYQLTRQLSLSADGNYQQTEAVGQSGPQSGFNRNYFSASAGLSWQPARHWRLAGHYRYRQQEFDGVGGIRTSNAITLNLTYEWEGLREAR